MLTESQREDLRFRFMSLPDYVRVPHEHGSMFGTMLFTDDPDVVQCAVCKQLIHVQPNKTVCVQVLNVGVQDPDRFMELLAKKPFARKSLARTESADRPDPTSPGQLASLPQATAPVERNASPLDADPRLPAEGRQIYSTTSGSLDFKFSTPVGQEVTITGISGSFDGRPVVIKRLDGGEITVLNEDASSQAANRLRFEGVSRVMHPPISGRGFTRDCPCQSCRARQIDADLRAEHPSPEGMFPLTDRALAEVRTIVGEDPHCCFVNERGERCEQMATFWIGRELEFDSYTHGCGDHVGDLREDDMCVISLRDGKVVRQVGQK